MLQSPWAFLGIREQVYGVVSKMIIQIYVVVIIIIIQKSITKNKLDSVSYTLYILKMI